MFVKQKELILFLKIKRHIYKNERAQALKVFVKIPFGTIKIKSFMFIVLPIFLINMIKS